MASCRICGRTPDNCNGWLQRVNPVGIDGIFECRPACGVELSNNDRVLGALEADEPLEDVFTDKPQPSDSAYSDEDGGMKEWW